VGWEGRPSLACWGAIGSKPGDFWPWLEDPPAQVIARIVIIVGDFIRGRPTIVTRVTWRVEVMNFQDANESPEVKKVAARVYDL
jgi:hypothetical protein